MKKILQLILIVSYFYTNLFAFDLNKITQSCENKNYKLCSALGTIYSLGIEVDQNITKSIVYHMIACRGEIKYCSQFKKILKKEKAINFNDKTLFYYSKLACDLNDSNSCYFVGDYLSNNQTNINNKESISFYEKSCKRGNKKGCYKTGMHYYNKISSGKDNIKASIYFKKSCDGNFSSACFNLGIMHEKGFGVDKNHTNAIMYYNKACNMNNISACFNLALTYKDRTNIKIKKLFEKTCKSKKSLGCYDLANIYMLGQGVIIDYIKAREFYQKSCNNGETNGCNNIGYIYQHGLGVDKDDIKAKKYYKMTCSMGNKLGCNNLKLFSFPVRKKTTKDK